MVRQSLFFLSCVVAVASAFMGQQLKCPTFTSSKSTLRMGGGSGYATSPAGKKEKIAILNGLLSKSEMIFSIPAGKITVAKQQKLRLMVPQTTTVQVVKNTLLERSIGDTPYDCLISEASGQKLLTGANMWFFIEDDIKGTVTAYKQFLKEAGLRETHPVIGGVIENVVYDENGVERIGALPSKMELYAQIAGAIKAVPTKVARVVKEPGSKLARAIKLATMPEE